jgi:hypothetical protein
MAMQVVTEQNKQNLEMGKLQQAKSEAWFSMISDESLSIVEPDVFKDFEKLLEII